MEKRELRHREWLNMPAVDADYLEPGYYGRILRPYVFEGRSDLGLLEDFVKGLSRRSRTMLEIGPGTGRATQVLLQALPDAKYLGVDLSARMVHASAQRFESEATNCRWIVQDALAFLKDCAEEFDLVVSLWSISHAVHQSIAKTGTIQSAVKAIHSLFHERVARDGHVFIIHFDSCSDEQEISLTQRRRVWKFLQPGQPSPSQQAFDHAIEKLAKSGNWHVGRRKMVGEEIVYCTMDEALESYMNLHMEGWFNQRPERDEVLQQLEAELLKRRRSDGKIYVRPGCLVYTARRL